MADMTIHNIEEPVLAYLRGVAEAEQVTLNDLLKDGIYDFIRARIADDEDMPFGTWLYLMTRPGFDLVTR